MRFLPQEILDHIVSFVDLNTLASMIYVSKSLNLTATKYPRWLYLSTAKDHVEHLMHVAESDARYRIEEVICLDRVFRYDIVCDKRKFNKQLKEAYRGRDLDIDSWHLWRQYKEYYMFQCKLHDSRAELNTQLRKLCNLKSFRISQHCYHDTFSLPDSSSLDKASSWLLPKQSSPLPFRLDSFSFSLLADTSYPISSNEPLSIKTNSDIFGITVDLDGSCEMMCRNIRAGTSHGLCHLDIKLDQASLGCQFYAWYNFDRTIPIFSEIRNNLKSLRIKIHAYDGVDLMGPKAAAVKRRKETPLFLISRWPHRTLFSKNFETLEICGVSMHNDDIRDFILFHGSTLRKVVFSNVTFNDDPAKLISELCEGGSHFLENVWLECIDCGSRKHHWTIPRSSKPFNFADHLSGWGKRSLRMIRDST